MVGWVELHEGRRIAPPEVVHLLGLEVLRVGLPAGAGRWRVMGALKQLARRGVRRVLLPVGFPYGALLARAGLTEVDPLPLCIALAPRLAETLLDDIPLRQRVVLLRGHGSAASLLPALANALCPLTATLLADTDRGFDALAGQLRLKYGAALLAPTPKSAPQVTLELSPGPPEPGKTLKLWGRPDLSGLTLRTDLPLPPSQADSLPLLALLWETGRLKIGQIQVCEQAVPLDIGGKKSYNS